MHIFILPGVVVVGAVVVVGVGAVTIIVIAATVW